MTKRQGVFPPEGTEDGTFHFCTVRGGVGVPMLWTRGVWFRPRSASSVSPETLFEWGGVYLGPAPTYEQSRADAADARRFRWVASLDHGGTREIRLSGVKRNGDVWGHGISWSGTPCHADIRAAIDAAMKGDSDA